MTWILLRGLSREHRHWENFPQILQSTFPAARIILPDLPGSGVHHLKRCPANIRNILEFVRADIAISRLSKPVYLLGLSMGAMVAVEWIRQYPQECAGAVLMNTSVKGLNPFYQRLQPGNYGSLLKSLFFKKNARTREEIIFDLTCNLNPDHDSVIRNWVNYAREYPVSRTNTLRQLTAASLYKIPASKPGSPLLLLNGLGDRLVSPRCSETLAQHWNLSLQSHATAGHDLTLDDGTWVCMKITEWLQKQS
ncbi:MAG: hypothetical protein QG652_242 [Pseudomonadota bacterium]|nr:hypothetical protein [Pseudomonadota bacterium]